jgi:hypothetical protein
MTRLRATRAANDSGSVTVQTSARLMDDYVYASDVDAATDLISVQESDGSYSLLYIGAEANIMLLRQDEHSDTGWTEEALGNKFPASQVVAATDADGNLVVFAVGPNAAQVDVYVMTRSSSGWADWQPIAPDINVPTFTQVWNLATKAINGTIGLWAVVRPSPEQPGSSSLWQVAWNQPDPAWTLMASTDQPILQFCNLADWGQCLLIANTAAASPVALDLYALPIGAGGGTLQPLAQTITFSTLTVGTQTDGNSAVFIADDGKMSGTCQIEYLNGSNLSGGFITVDTDTMATTLLVMRPGTNPLMLFAIDIQNKLHLIAAPTLSENGDDFDFSLKFTTATTATNSQGDAELIGYVPGKGLLRLWSNPAGSSGRSAWSHAAIEYQPVNGALKQSSTYAVTLTFFDVAGVPLASHALELRASTDTAASINGATCFLGPTQAVTVNTDGRGQVRVTLPANSLGAPALSAALPRLMQTGEDFSVSPDAAIKNRLSNISDDEVSSFINPDYAAPTTVANVRKAIQETMASISDQPFATVRYQTVGRTDLKTPLQGGSGRSHIFRVVDGRATFSTVTAEQANARIAEIVASPDSLFDWFEDVLETVTDALVGAVSWTYENVITPIADGIYVAITFISDTIQVAWAGIIDTVEDAFRFVESVFDAVKTFFQRLYNFFAWLLSNARKDIWRTKEYFENLISQGMIDLSIYANQGASAAEGFFSGLENDVEQLFAQIEASLGLIDANQAINASPTSMADGVGETFIEFIEDASSSANWLFDKISDMLGLAPHISLPESVISGAVGLVAQVGSTFGEQIQTLLTTFLERMQALATSTTSFGNVLLKTILDEAKDILIAVLKLLDSVVSSILSFFANNLSAIASGMFGAAIGNSVVQALYDLINPGASENLTIQGLGCLLLGFVTTVVYKIIFDTAPFPNGFEDTKAASQSPNVPLIIAGLVQTTIWFYYDIQIDSMPRPDSKWSYYWIGLLSPLAIQLGTKPPGHPNFDSSENTAKWAAWFTGFASIMYKILWGIGMGTKIVPTGPRNSLLGTVGLSVCGLGTLSTNIWNAVENSADALGWISAITSPLSSIVKPAKFLIPPPANIEVMVIIDIISDSGGGVSKIVKGGMLD